MIRWEYMATVFENQNINMDQLNENGKNGWELAAILPAGTGLVVLFKRQLRVIES